VRGVYGVVLVWLVCSVAPDVVDRRGQLVRLDRGRRPGTRLGSCRLMHPVEKWTFPYSWPQSIEMLN